MPSPKPIPTSQPPSFAQVASLHAQDASQLSEEEVEALEEPVAFASSMIETAYYEPEAETVVITFNNGDVQEYPCDIPTYRGLLSAPSAGKYVWSNFL